MLGAGRWFRLPRAAVRGLAGGGRARRVGAAGGLLLVRGLRLPLPRGGLGHLGVQYAAKMGFYTVAVARGQDKEPLAKKLGAAAYIDSDKNDAAAELNRMIPTKPRG